MKRGSMDERIAMQDVRARRRLGRLAAVMIAVALFASDAVGAAVEREGMRFEDSVRLGGRGLVLNGVGVRAAAWFKGYVAALYLTRRSADAEEIYILHGAKRIAVRMLVDVTPELLAKTFADGIRKNYKGDALEALQPRMDAFDNEIRSIAGGVRKGQEIDLDFEPTVGTHVLVGGKPIGEPIAGDDFYVALLKMFIGERAIDKGLRAGLLGSPGS